MKEVFWLENKHFVRNKITWLGVGMVLIIGLYAIFHGKNLIDDQLQTIDKLEQTQANQLQENIEHHAHVPIGELCYYQFYYTKDVPSKWAAFSIGQRDVNAYTLNIRMLAIEGQLYDTGLSNPVTLVTGNLDLSFVFIFLIPLLIITLTFNLRSAEQESGVWKLVASHPVSLRKILWLKFSVRFMAVLLLIVVLMVLATFILDLPLDKNWIGIFMLLIVYQIFWFLVTYLVTLLNQNSNFNAVCLLSFWLFMVILIPAFSSVLIAKAIPLPEALATTVTQRQAYHEKWDMPKDVVMQPFYKDYPQYKSYTIPEDKFSYGWYYAMMYAADKEAECSSDLLFKKLEKRKRTGNFIGCFLPSLFLQNKFNAMAKTDLTNHINYLKSVKHFHRKISEFFYPYVFQLVLPKNVDWARLPKYKGDTTFDKKGSKDCSTL